MKISDRINAGAASLLIAATFVQACSPGGVGESWSISQRKDEMTDVTYGVGAIKLSGSNNDLDLQVACGSAGRPIYEFKTFDKEGQGVSIDKGQNISTKVLLLRVDDGKPYNVFDDASPYSNQVIVRGDGARRLAAARQIVVRIPLPGESETYTIDQTASDFRAFVAPCLNEQAAAVLPASGVPVEMATSTSPRGEPTFEPQIRCWSPPSGPHVLDDPDQAISFQEVQEIEQVTGREYVSGDSIYGRAEDCCPA